MQVLQGLPWQQTLNLTHCVSPRQQTPKPEAQLPAGVPPLSVSSCVSLGLTRQQNRKPEAQLPAGVPPLSVSPCVSLGLPRQKTPRSLKHSCVLECPYSLSHCLSLGLPKQQTPKSEAQLPAGVPPLSVSLSLSWLTQAADPEAWSTVACWSAPTGQAVLLAEAGPVDARLRLTGLVSEGDHREQGQDWTRTESYTTTIPGRAEIHLINIK